MAADVEAVPIWQRRWFCVAVCVLPVLAFCLLPGQVRIAGLFHDDGSYVEIAKSLVERGEYRDGHLPAAIATARYPPGVPLIVAGGLLFGGDLDAALTFVRIANVAFLALGLWAFFGLLVRVGLRHAALGLLIALAWGASSLDFTRLVMSEVPYLGVSLAAILGLVHVEGRDARPWRDAILLAALAFVAVALRSFGIVLVLTIWLHLIWVRRVRTALRFAAVVVPPVVVLQSFMSRATTPMPGYEDVTVYGLSYFRIFRESLEWVDATVMVNGLRSLFYSVYHVLPLANQLPIGSGLGSALLWALVVLVFGAIGLGVFVELREREVASRVRPWHVLVLGTFLMVLPWPADPSRFLWPLLPFLLLLIARGVHRFAGVRGAVVASFVLAAVSVVGTSMVVFPSAEGELRVSARGRDTAEILALADRLKRLPEDALVASTIDTMLASHGDVKGVWGWTITADEHVYRDEDALAAFGLGWGAAPWILREMQAAQAYYLQKSGETLPPGAPEPRFGDAREPMLAAFETDQDRVREQFRRLGVTHAVVSMYEGSPPYEILLARLVRKLVDEGRGRLLRRLSTEKMQVWRIHP